MLDQLVKAAVLAVVAYAADRFVKNKTGKHIHEHAIDFATKLWRRLKAWASRYLRNHPRVRKVYLSAVSIAAEIKKAKDQGLQFVRIKVFGKDPVVPTAKVIKDEKVSLGEVDAVLQKAKTEAVLAIRN